MHTEGYTHSKCVGGVKSKAYEPLIYDIINRFLKSHATVPLKGCPSETKVGGKPSCIGHKTFSDFEPYGLRRGKNPAVL